MLEVLEEEHAGTWLPSDRALAAWRRWAPPVRREGRYLWSR